MYFYEAITQRINNISARFQAEKEVIQIMYNFALRATEVINNAKHIITTGGTTTIIGAKRGDTEVMIDQSRSAELQLFQSKWENNYLKMSFSKLKRFCDDIFSDFRTDRRTNNVSTHILRFAKAQEIYVLTSDIQKVMSALREKSQRNAEVYITAVFYSEYMSPFTPVNYS